MMRETKNLRDSIPTLKQMFNNFFMIQDWIELNMQAKCT
jgi:hypothetical protein